MTREEWLKKAVRSMRPLLRKADIKMRAKWQVSVSLASSRTAIGQCWYEAASASGKTANIFVCPTVGDPVEVLGVLLHEMIHAALPMGVHHGPQVRKGLQADRPGGEAHARNPRTKAQGGACPARRLPGHLSARRYGGEDRRQAGNQGRLLAGVCLPG
jgi:hypothetical protein